MSKFGLFTRNPDEFDSVTKTIIEMRKRQLDEVHPPGREEQVKELKKKFPKESAYKIAWASYNKSRHEEVEPLDEEKDRTPKRRSPSAAALRLPQYRKKVIPSGKVYDRKKMKNEEVEPIDELSKEKLGAYAAKASSSHTDAVLSKNKRKLANRTIGLGRAKALMKDEAELVEELLDEATRKHFRMVADLLKNIPDHGKRKEMAGQHAEVFAKQNPRFDRGRFMQAAGVDEKKA